jgi:radical SAM protein with 4Fe4S-binding SPASM domain
VRIAASRILRRALLPAFRRLEARRHRLSYLFLELTQACNLACRHCGSDCSHASGVPPLPRELILGALREIAAAQDPHQVMVVLTGGEPLCYPGVFDLGAAIHGLGFPWGMVSNGFAWGNAQLAAARDSGMASITLSLDGFEDDHDWLRGRPGSFARALATLRALLADPFYQALDVVTCVHPRNLPRLPAFRDFLAELGLARWRIFTICPIGRAAADPELQLAPEEFRELMAKIETFRAHPGLQVVYSEAGYLGRHECRVRDQPYFCRAGINIAGIMVNGDLLACPNIDRRFSQGNLRRDRFLDVWNHGYQAFRDREWMRVGDCAACGEWSLCQGNAFHLREAGIEAPRLCHCRTYGLA